MEKIIYVDQALHGYANGHQLLASSCVLDLADRKRMDELSDLSGQHSGEEFVDYYTGYPIEQGEKYVISKTWYAHEMMRPGCVWTHSLIFHTEDLSQISDFPKLLGSFQRPVESQYEAYAYQIPLPSGGKKHFSSYDIQQLQYEIFTVCSSAAPKYVFVDPPSLQFDNELFMVLCGLPEEILRTFTFCTMSYEDRNYGDSVFQYQMIPMERKAGLARYYRRAPVCEAFYSIEKYPYWIQQYASALLSDTLNSLYTFIRQYGADRVTLENFSRFSRLYFALTGEAKLSLTEYADSIETLFPGEPSILQKTIELVLDDAFSLDTFKEQEYMILEIIEMKCLSLEKPHWKKLSGKVVRKTPEKLRPYLEEYIAGTPPAHLRKSVEDMIRELPPDALYAASGMDRKICFVLIRKKPSLLLCPDIWKQPKRFQQEMLGAINQDLNSKELRELLTIILQVDTENIAEDLYRFWGQRLLPVLYDVLRAADFPMKSRLYDWTPIVLKNQYLLLKELLNLPSPKWRRELFLKLDMHAAGLARSVSADVWQRLYREFFAMELSPKERIDVAIQFFPVVFCTDYHFGDDFIRDIVKTVYQAAKADTLSYAAWNRYQHILPQVEDNQSWDRCLRIRKAMEEKGYLVSLMDS